MGMSKQSHEPGVVLGYKECGHIDVSQRAPFIEEKRFTEPKEAERFGRGDSQTQDADQDGSQCRARTGAGQVGNGTDVTADGGSQEEKIKE
ncbi:hypothetical protein GBF38_018127 [Nibea albiflora]|uniref:Uncharacterized protein n=1 Tax=Nibea albiflora TaxID=240163 RepID=A0ACB7EG29_NIBAL|nr:hypothetical protein GBF38_018127 [Nibea albiflora]